MDELIFPQEPQPKPKPMNPPSTLSRRDFFGQGVKTVAASALDDLGIAADDGNGGTFAGAAHGGGNAVKLGQWKALFQHKANGQTQWLSSGHRDIIDAAMDGQIADAAARKEQR